PGVPPAPQGASGANVVPLIVEGARGIKGLIWSKPLKDYSQGTGAEHLNVYTKNGIQEAVARIANELHSQYLLTHKPHNLDQAAFHAIDVRVSRAKVKVRARPGYFFIPTATEAAPPPTNGEKK